MAAPTGHNVDSLISILPYSHTSYYHSLPVSVSLGKVDGPSAALPNGREGHAGQLTGLVNAVQNRHFSRTSLEQPARMVHG